MRNLPKEILYSLLALAIFAALASSGCSESSDSVKGLKIAEMDLSAEEVTGATVTINVTTYVENQGRLTSKNASLLLKAYETKNNLLETQVRSDMGPIERGTTANITNTLELPKKGSYRIEATLNPVGPLLWKLQGPTGLRRPSLRRMRRGAQLRGRSTIWRV